MLLNQVLPMLAQQLGDLLQALLHTGSVFVQLSHVFDASTVAFVEATFYGILMHPALHSCGFRGAMSACGRNLSGVKDWPPLTRHPPAAAGKSVAQRIAGAILSNTNRFRCHLAAAYVEM